MWYLLELHWYLFEIGPFLFLMYNCTWSWFCAHSLALCVTCVYKISAALQARSHFIWFDFFSNLFFSNRHLPKGLQKTNNTDCEKAQIISNNFSTLRLLKWPAQPPDPSQIVSPFGIFWDRKFPLWMYIWAIWSNFEPKRRGQAGTT